MNIISSGELLLALQQPGNFFKNLFFLEVVLGKIYVGFSIERIEMCCVLQIAMHFVFFVMWKLLNDVKIVILKMRTLNKLRYTLQVFRIPLTKLLCSLPCPERGEVARMVIDFNDMWSH